MDECSVAFLDELGVLQYPAHSLTGSCLCPGALLCVRGQAGRVLMAQDTFLSLLQSQTRISKPRCLL